MRVRSYLADFDSAIAMLRVLANFLHGWDFPLLGTMPPWREALMLPVAATVNALPTADCAAFGRLG